MLAATIVPDCVENIQTAVVALSETHDLVLTSGGTGFGPRDVTPEAVAAILHRQSSGIVHLMLAASLKVTVLAALSRPVCGVRGSCLVLTLPGSPKAVRECLAAVLPVLEHAVNLCRAKSPTDCNEFVKTMSAVAITDHCCIHKTLPTPCQNLHSLPLGSGIAARARSSPYPMISYEEAVTLITANCKRTGSVDISVLDLRPGMVISQNVVSTVNAPSFRASSVDGYAVTSK